MYGEKGRQKKTGVFPSLERGQIAFSNPSPSKGPEDGPNSCLFARCRCITIGRSSARFVIKKGEIHGAGENGVCACGIAKLGRGRKKAGGTPLATTATTCDILPFERASLCIVFCPYEIVCFIFTFPFCDGLSSPSYYCGLVVCLPGRQSSSGSPDFQTVKEPMWCCGDQVERSRFCNGVRFNYRVLLLALAISRSVRVATKRELPKRVRDAFLHLWATNNLMSTSIAHLAFDLIHT